MKNLGLPEKAWLPTGVDFKHQSSRWEIISMGQGGLPGGARFLPRMAGLCHGADCPVMCKNFKAGYLKSGNILEIFTPWKWTNTKTFSAVDFSES